MSLIQQFIQQQLNKNPSSIIIQKLQSSHSAVQDLLSNIQYSKQGSKIQQINIRIQRLTIFKQANEKIINMIHKSQNNNCQWLFIQSIRSPIIIKLVEKQQKYVNQMINKLVKKIFMNNSNIEQFLVDIQNIKVSINILENIRQDLQNNRQIKREKIKNFDVKNQDITQKIKFFDEKIRIFNEEVHKLIQQLCSFQSVIINQFKTYFVQVVQPSIFIQNQQPQPQFYQEQHIYQEQPFYQETQTFQPYDHRNQASGLVYQQSNINIPVSSKTSQNWNNQRQNTNQISHLGLKSKLSINNYMPNRRESNVSILQRYNNSKLRSTYQ